jgi:hypothetical protein
VENATWFSLSDFGPQDVISNRFGLFDLSGAARPALAAFQHAGSATPEPCGLWVDRGGPSIDVQVPWEQQNRSGDLLYRASASDPDGLSTLALLVDGRQLRVTNKGKLQGRWTGWRKVSLGPHTVSFRAKDKAQNISTESFTVNKVAYGDGEPIRTRIAVGIYGTGRARLAGGRWRPFGRAAAASVRRMVRAQRHFRPGRYRAVIEYTGYKSFRPSMGRKAFTVS